METYYQFKEKMKLKSDDYVAILDENMKTSAKSLGLGRRWVFQHDNDSKYKSKAML